MTYCMPAGPLLSVVTGLYEYVVCGHGSATPTGHQLTADFIMSAATASYCCLPQLVARTALAAQQHLALLTSAYWSR